MFGFENISGNNGWAMAAVGATIVFCGLVVLSFVISQIHKLLKLWDDRENLMERFKKAAPTAAAVEKVDAPVYSERHLPSVDELADIYRPLVEQLEEPFKISQLFEIANKNDLPHPHLSIQRLQEAGLLVARGDGTFTWNKP
ncbi:MAG: OadG family protein [Deltaproteobacteria bacterium]